MAIFFVFAMLLWAALQITNMFGDTLSEILVLNWYQGTLGEHSVLIIAFADFRNLIYLNYTVFLKTIWYQTSYDFLV
jgi:NHS family xanthosine MFS transporter